MVINEETIKKIKEKDPETIIGILNTIINKEEFNWEELGSKDSTDEVHNYTHVRKSIERISELIKQEIEELSNQGKEVTPIKFKEDILSRKIRDGEYPAKEERVNN